MKRARSFRVFLRPDACKSRTSKGEGPHVSAPTRTEGHGACPRGWGEMFAEERPPPKKIYTPDGKYEFVEDGAWGQARVAWSE